MPQMITAPLSRKAQLTLPKKVRDFLDVRASGDLVGFVIDEAHHRVNVTKVDLVPADAPFTDEELDKLLRLAKQPGGKIFDRGEDAIRYLGRFVARHARKVRA